jgi:hypothetical protein
MTLQDRVTAPVVRPVFVGLLDFAGDPAMGWTGPGLFAPTGTGDPDLDGNVFSSVEGAAEISDFVETLSGARGVSVTFSGHDNDAEAMRQIVRDRRVWRLRKAKIWLFFLSDDEKTVHPEFRQLFSGVIAEARTVRKFGAPATIILDLDIDLQNAGGAPSRLLDHARFNPADAFSSFILDLAKGPIAGAAAAAGGSAPRGSGREGPQRVRF